MVEREDVKAYMDIKAKIQVWATHLLFCWNVCLFCAIKLKAAGMQSALQSSGFGTIKHEACDNQISTLCLSTKSLEKGEDLPVSLFSVSVHVNWSSVTLYRQPVLS